MTLTTFVALFLSVGGAQETETRFVLSMEQEIRNVIDAQSEREWQSALDALQENAGDQHERLVPQLFLFLRQATTTREAMAFGIIRQGLEIPDDHVIRALEPFREGADDAMLAALAGVLSEFEEEEEASE
ncbi:MAG: hypothetical protein F4Y14_20140, partial [Acidobacteria bacterium]|nr:hypothetical protein [Acidobacteriota bacterium]